jgi:TRAP-type C4-dicarboxylate transport system substrate-binding protein
MPRSWLLASILLPSLALGAPTLRIATLAPDGTGWARELRDWAKSVERDAEGAVEIKLLFGGLAGDEPEALERIRRGQVDGALSGGHICETVAPSLRALKVPGLLQNRDEARFVMRRLRPLIDKEAKANGFTNLGEGGIGPVIVFSRRPVRTLAELRGLTLWSGRNEMMLKLYGALGLHVTNEAISEVSASYAAGRIDGFLTTPSVALAWQWSSQARHFSDLRVSFLASCLMVTNASFDALPLDAQRAVRSGVDRLVERSEALAREQDEALLGRVFPKQGLKSVPVDEVLIADFREAARAVRERIDPKLISPDLLRELLVALADYRAEHRSLR